MVTNLIPEYTLISTFKSRLKEIKIPLSLIMVFSNSELKRMLDILDRYVLKKGKDYDVMLVTSKIDSKSNNYVINIVYKD